MKKILLPVMTCLLVVAACKKSGDGTSNTLLLSEVYKNSLLEAEYIYSTDKRMVRLNEYSTVSNQSKLFVYVLFDYDQSDKITKWKVFSPNDTLNNYSELTYDNQGRVSRRDWRFGNSLVSYYLYEYDQQDRIFKITEKNGGSNANLSQFQYTYDDQGRITRQTRYYWSTNKWLVDLDYTYVATGKNVYDHWQPFMLYPSDLSRNELNMASKRILDYDNMGNIVQDYKDSATNKKYNGSGYLVSQTITRKWTIPVKPNDGYEMEYVYVQ